MPESGETGFSAEETGMGPCSELPSTGLACPSLQEGATRNGARNVGGKGD